MEIKAVYPAPRKRSGFMRVFRYVCAWLFAAGAVACPVVNLICGGKAWSVIVLWSIYTVSGILFSPLIANNLISQGTRLMINVGVLLILIDVLLAPGWAHTVVPIVLCAAVIVLSCLFFTNVKKQRHNVMPLILSLLAVLIASLVSLFLLSDSSVPMIVLGSASGALLIASVAVMRGHLLVELKKYFHTR